MPTVCYWHPYYPGVCRCQAEWPLNGPATWTANANVWTASRVTVPPAVEPLTLEEVKLDRRVDHDLDDALLQALIQASREWCENWTATSFVTQTRETIFTGYDADVTVLPYGPVQSIESVEGDGPYTVTYVVGYPPVDGSDPTDYVGNIPQSIKVAMKLLLGDWYENREHSIVGTISSNLQIGVQSLLGFYRVRRGWA